MSNIINFLINQYFLIKKYELNKISNVIVYKLIMNDEIESMHCTRARMLSISALSIHVLGIFIISLMALSTSNFLSEFPQLF